jgi:membrane protein required for colicin V production
VRALEKSGLNWVDAAILAVIAGLTYSSFHAGLIREIVTIVGAALAVVLAGLLYDDFARDVEVGVKDQQTARVVAFCIIFGATILASQLIAIFLKQAAALLMLGPLDSMGGAAIGLLKALILIEAALIVAITFPKLGLEDSVRDSVLGSLLVDGLPFLRPMLPDEFQRAIDSF